MGALDFDFPIDPAAQPKMTKLPNCHAWFAVAKSAHFGKLKNGSTNRTVKVVVSRTGGRAEVVTGEERCGLRSERGNT